MGQPKKGPPTPVVHSTAKMGRGCARCSDGSHKGVGKFTRGKSPLPRPPPRTVYPPSRAASTAPQQPQPSPPPWDVHQLQQEPPTLVPDHTTAAEANTLTPVPDVTADAETPTRLAPKTVPAIRLDVSHYLDELRPTTEDDMAEL